MEQRTVAFCTLGCKVNQYETNAMMQDFIEAGYEIVEFEERADIYVVNTCTVTNMADKKSRQMLRRVKEINPDSVLVAVGCYVQVAKEKLEEMPEIDLILGVNEKSEIVEYVEATIFQRNELQMPKEEKERTEKYRQLVGVELEKNGTSILEKISNVAEQEEFVEFGPVTYTEKTRAVIKVQDGCNQFCSYCIIPYARGRIRSRRPEWVIKEITKIAEKGIKEVVLTGIHLASYGKDFNKNIVRDISDDIKYEVGEGEFLLIDLLEEIQKIEGIERIRLGSLEPTLITENFVKRLSKLSKICGQFHLSLQSGCNETLKRMNRKYTIEEFEKGVELLRKTYPEVHLTTDIIVGFSGETEEEFQKTYEFLKRIKFYKMHIFKYSPRSGTVAAKMPNQIDGNIKETRSNLLMELSDKNEVEYQKRYIGKKVEVLLEEREGEYLKGHTTNYMVVKVKTLKELENTIQKLSIIGVGDLELIGDR
ncbi:MAG: tRNA (N(6)-L-threonylcarbamoyladenosine(37)-C(2))-methylthiotransferase MtaB [Clostridia bacterium]|jgi:threonylcarbamoyladenosine tRNA methylthiotransferase MtaB|nr:tRNA (N(6)-L-threonylcarbamoyladenosine(37)-C(2))-methylthiotransferase MtaB [Clostridia bacterium]